MSVFKHYLSQLPDEVRAALDGEISRPDLTATRKYHEPTITPNFGTNIPLPFFAPNLEVYGSTLVAEMTVNSDAMYRVFKIPSNYLENASFHVHWTKSSDAVEDGNEVRWQLEYQVWKGQDTDLAGATTVVTIDDTYDDGGTTTRVVQRTVDIEVSGFVPGYYVGVCVMAITPAGTPISSEPALVSVDLTYTELVNS